MLEISVEGPVSSYFGIERVNCQQMTECKCRKSLQQVKKHVALHGRGRGQLKLGKGAGVSCWQSGRRRTSACMKGALARSADRASGAGVSKQVLDIVQAGVNAPPHVAVLWPFSW